MDKKVKLERVRREARVHLKKSRGSHDAEHTERVMAVALRIAAKEGADRFITASAAALHDIARHIEDRKRGRIDHAALGAKISAKILKKHGYTRENIKNIIHCIESHRFRGALRPLTKEAKCLFDADKLDSIGAVGIARAFLFAGEVGAKLHNKGADMKKTRPYTEDDTAYREYMVKLRHVRSRMLTAEGRRMAAKRHVFMKAFFCRLNMEVEGKC